MARIGKKGKKIAVLIASNGFVSVRKHCRSSFKRLHRPVFRKIGWQTCDCVNKCTVPFHLNNLDGCQLKCFGGSGARFQHQNKSLTLNGALHAAFDWRVFLFILISFKILCLLIVDDRMTPFLLPK